MDHRLHKTMVASLAVLSSLAPQGSAIGSDFHVDSWSLDAGLLGNVPYGDAVFFQTVTNPFVDSGQAWDRASSASASFDFWWNDQFGSLLIQGSQQCVAQNPPPNPDAVGIELCASEGSFHMTSNADLLFTIDAGYSYDLLGPNMLARMTFGVGVVNGDGLFNAARIDDTFTSYPASGTLTINDQVLLPAGQPLLFSYQQFLDVEGNTGALGTGDGYVHFTLSEVAEPTALLPLALGALLLRRHRTR